MMRNTKSESSFIDNAELHSVLKQYDPVVAPSQASLAALEADILAKIEQRPAVPASWRRYVPVWMSAPGWALQAAACAFVVMIVSGFLVDRVVTDMTGDVTLANATTTPGLFVLADDAYVTPTATNQKWGDDDDDDQ